MYNITEDEFEAIGTTFACVLMLGIGEITPDDVVKMGAPIFRLVNESRSEKGMPLYHSIDHMLGVSLERIARQAAENWTLGDRSPSTVRVINHLALVNGVEPADYASNLWLDTMLNEGGPPEPDAPFAT